MFKSDSLQVNCHDRLYRDDSVGLKTLQIYQGNYELCENDINLYQPIVKI